MITAYRDIEKIINQTQQAVEQITELDLSSVKVFRFNDRLKSLLERCGKLSILKLSECQLNSLEKIPALDIVALDLSMNKLKDSDLGHLAKYTNLTILNLSDNFIQSLASLEELKKCSKLKDLELAGNEIQNHPNYRQEVFGQLKGLELLDKLDPQGQPPQYDSYSDDVISEGESDYFDEDEDEYEEDEQSGQSQQSERLQKIKKFNKRQQHS